MQYLVYKRKVHLKRLPMKKILPTALLLVSIFGFCHAADTAPAKQDPAWLSQARASIKAEKYDQAIQQLQAANETSSADWNNLLGYSLRKKQPPDLVGAEKYYQAALKIDPDHRGALEYYGKLKLMNNDLPGAEVLLAKLDKVCTFGCEEYSDLKEAVKKYKSKK
jgi:tetratricopeptide (TPR) repeat protein